MDRSDGRAPGFLTRIGDIVDRRRDAVFKELRSDSLLNRLTGSGMPFGWTVNPFRGCEVGCRYCYARPTHEYLGHTDPVDFEERIYVKISRHEPAAPRSEASARQRPRGGDRSGHRSLSAGGVAVPDHPARARGDGARAGPARRDHHQVHGPRAGHRPPPRAGERLGPPGQRLPHLAGPCAASTDRAPRAAPRSSAPGHAGRRRSGDTHAHLRDARSALDHGRRGGASSASDRRP